MCYRAVFQIRQTKWILWVTQTILPRFILVGTSRSIINNWNVRCNNVFETRGTAGCYLDCNRWFTDFYRVFFRPIPSNLRHIRAGVGKERWNRWKMNLVGDTVLWEYLDSRQRCEKTMMKLNKWRNCAVTPITHWNFP